MCVCCVVIFDFISFIYFPLWLLLCFFKNIVSILQESSGTELSPPHGIFLLSQENVTEASPETADILYQSSGSGSSNGTAIGPLLKWRGAGLTLAHLMPQLTGNAPCW